MKKSLLAVMLCLCMLLSGSVRPFFAYANDDGEEMEEAQEETQAEEKNEIEEKYQGSIENLNDKLEQLAAEEKKIAASIEDAKKDKEAAIREKYEIDSLIANTRETIMTLEERIVMYKNDIHDIEAHIEKKHEEIGKKQGEIDKSNEILRKRLRAMYMRDTSTTLGLIMGAESFSDMLTRVEYVSRIADHDRKLLEQLTEQHKGLENEKASLEVDIAALEESKAAVESDQAATQSMKNKLDVQSQIAQIQVQDLDQMQREYEADRAANKKLQDAAKSELDRIFREIEWSKNAYAGGAMAWPLPAYAPGRGGNVTCEFGPRFGGSDYHTGIDLSGSGVYGSNIVAANDGKVVVANWAWRAGVGYGIYVIIDHGVDNNGNSISTLYAHCSNILVSVGQEVKRGQAIAQVGSTGWSTGPHLHFEVRINQKQVNPRPYIFA